MERLEIRLSGFGGQGIVRSGEIIGKAAVLYDGRYATFTQSYGPESRGGAAAAQVAIANDPVELSYPHVIDPSILVVMSQGAYNKYVPGFRRDGLLIVDESLVELDEAADGVEVLGIPATRIAEELGRRIVANVVMLGFLAAVTDIVSPEALRKAVLDSVPKGTEELNARAFEVGFEYGEGVKRETSYDT
ncbi:MAG TPA: pyruvate ferredoxin oxidoreductase [Anaerolineales bacterium]|nr:pyruvate ferredoxin oxidoreductase [Anaerolineae bacterium]HIQ02739.1 pyruvate ferredoxin oxidoreductase [Anaerolineales bacterium]